MTERLQLRGLRVYTDGRVWEHSGTQWWAMSAPSRPPRAPGTKPRPERQKPPRGTRWPVY